MPGARNAKKPTAASASDPQPSQGPQHFLIKSEPDEYSIDMLAAKPNATDKWDGIRNFRAKNLLKTMKVGDQLFFYHSSCKVPGIVGIAELVKEAYPDAQAFDPDSKYYDPKSTEADPRWFAVDVQLARRLRRQITLAELKSHAEGALQGMMLFNVSRLSVQTVSQQHWDFILSLEAQETPEPSTADKKAASAAGTGTKAQRGKGRGGSKGAKGSGGTAAEPDGGEQHAEEESGKGIGALGGEGGKGQGEAEEGQEVSADGERPRRLRAAAAGAAAATAAAARVDAGTDTDADADAGEEYAPAASIRKGVKKRRR